MTTQPPSHEEVQVNFNNEIRCWQPLEVQAKIEWLRLHDTPQCSGTATGREG